MFVCWYVGERNEFPSALPPAAHGTSATHSGIAKQLTMMAMLSKHFLCFSSLVSFSLRECSENAPPVQAYDV